MKRAEDASPPAGLPRLVLLMGVSGSGKTLVGQRLAELWGTRFFDGDDFHPAENVSKMSRGIPLSDEDRLPWLQRLRREIVDCAPPGGGWVLACSALRRSYRECLLPADDPSLALVFLSGSFDLIHSRISSRIGHFMKENLLRSQFEALEPPLRPGTLVVDVGQNPEQIVHEMDTRLRR